MYLDFLFERFSENLGKSAIIWREKEFSYNWLLEKVTEVQEFLCLHHIHKGSVVALRADFTPFSVACLLALMKDGMLVVPISSAVKTLEEFYTIAEVETVIEIQQEVPQVFHRSQKMIHHPLLQQLQANKHPGLILFSSGSTGKSKAVVHDFVPLLQKFIVKKRVLRTITFLLFDHIGGINTLLYVLSNCGTIVTLGERDPENVCRFIERFQVELLPSSPTFIHMLLMSRAYEHYDLSSLQLVTYGTEAMPEYTLTRFHQIFPHIELKQTYGLSELGILRSKSKGADSLWVKVGGEDYETKVVDDILYIKAKTAMLGYLNAPSPFDQDGWFNTQDRVIVDGEWLKILGRETDLINVGGQKVYPAEVESVLLNMENILDVSVLGMPNPIMGNVVAAKIKIEHEESVASLKKRVRQYCKDKLEQYKIPAHIEITTQFQVSERFKKVRL